MKTYIYDLSDPRTGHIRYIGKSINPKERLATHIRLARNGSKVHCKRWIDGLLKDGLHPILSILEETTRESANHAEKFWIAAFRLMGADLTNKTDGGDGQSGGYVWSKEAREHLSKKITGRKMSEKAKESLRKAFNRPEIRARRKEITSKLMADPVFRAKVQRGRTGRPMSEELKKKISAAWTPERKAAHAAEKSALPFDDRWRKQLSEALRVRWDKYRAKKAGAV